MAAVFTIRLLSGIGFEAERLKQDDGAVSAACARVHAIGQGRVATCEPIGKRGEDGHQGGKEHPCAAWMKSHHSQRPASKA